jgi:hypothetical protein
MTSSASGTVHSTAPAGTAVAFRFATGSGCFRADSIGTTFPAAAPDTALAPRTVIAPGSHASAHLPHAVHFSQSTEM